MKYAVFAYDMYYPSGGMRDLVAQYDSLEEAQTGAVDYAEDKGVPDTMQIAECSDAGLRLLLVSREGRLWQAPKDA